MNSNIRIRKSVVVGMIVLAAFSRLLPHPPNFAPITAMALFAAVTFERKWLALLVPLSAMLLSDLALEILYRSGRSEIPGFHPFTWVVYGTLTVIAGLGLLLRRRPQPLAILGTALAGSVVFFLATNFGVWAITDDVPIPHGYPKTLAGLLECYAMGIPFFHWTLLGDLTFSTVLFGGWALLKRTVPALSEPLPSPA